ncbi:MAG: hypothetical protein FWC69_01520 [Defluviitaleaceae bacterium]|nr:hypothetical protein [Defluviitaleaceae bacterium]
MKQKDKKIIILFPGKGYSTDMPLLYYAGFKYAMKGYKVLPIHYGALDKEKSRSEVLEIAKAEASKQVKDVDFSKYEEIVFASKSVGTVVAGYISEELDENIKHIYLTPIDETLQFINNKDDIIAIIVGEEDKVFDTNTLKAHCHQKGIELHVIEGAGHSLEKFENAVDNIDILKRIVELY